MSGIDKLKNAADDLTGKAKEKGGQVTDNEKLQAEGQGDQSSAQAKKAGEDVKDTAGNAKDAVTN